MFSTCSMTSSKKQWVFFSCHILRINLNKNRKKLLWRFYSVTFFTRLQTLFKRENRIAASQNQNWIILYFANPKYLCMMTVPAWTNAKYWSFLWVLQTSLLDLWRAAGSGWLSPLSKCSPLLPAGRAGRATLGTAAVGFACTEQRSVSATLAAPPFCIVKCAIVWTLTTILPQSLDHCTSRYTWHYTSLCTSNCNRAGERQLSVCVSEDQVGPDRKKLEDVLLWWWHARWGPWTGRPPPQHFTSQLSLSLRATSPPGPSTWRARGSTWTSRRTRGEGSSRSLRCPLTDERKAMNEMK